MNLHFQVNFKLFLLLSIILLITACTAGSVQFTGQAPAGFWYGLWHGAISIITLIIHLFNESILVYETHNSGGWYDFGFLLGVISIWGGGCHVKCKSAARKKRDKEWEEVGNKVELKFKRKLKEWAEDEDWEDLGDKVAEKIKRKIREWAEKD